MSPDMPDKQHNCNGSMDVCLFPTSSMDYCSNPQRIDEAGLYLSTFKQYEHKPPDIIKERVDKDYNSILRTSLTSISRVNKTDVETLRTSLGVRVRPYSH